MSSVRVFAVENKLAALLREPGGKTGKQPAQSEAHGDALIELTFTDAEPEISRMRRRATT